MIEDKYYRIITIGKLLDNSGVGDVATDRQPNQLGDVLQF
jgi:hypothetical protein